MKICQKCCQEKLFTDFYKNVTSPDGLQRYCKNCDKIYRKNNRDSILKNKKKYREANKEKISKYTKLKSKNKNSNTSTLKNSIRNKKYKEANRSKINAAKAKRRATKLNATPKWLTLCELTKIEELYEIAQMFKLYTGQEYHVDHIVPLQGKNVCGLHVPWNLQVLLAKENLSKHNKLLEN